MRDSTQSSFIINTKGQGLYEFTVAIRSFVANNRVESGLLTLFVRHTSCSILIQENSDPSVQHDLKAFFAKLIPSANDAAMNWITHTAEGPDDMPAHIKSAILPTSLSIPVFEQKLALGAWQGVYLFEHRDREMSRRVVAHISS